jgi:hypothetical protein
LSVNSFSWLALLIKGTFPYAFTTDESYMGLSGLVQFLTPFCDKVVILSNIPLSVLL